MATTNPFRTSVVSVGLLLALLASACTGTTADEAPTRTTASLNSQPTTIVLTPSSTPSSSPSTTMAVEPTGEPASVATVQGLVAAANPMATDAGMAVLEDGGSAVDAAIAVQAVLGLVEPQSSGLGGGAFLLHYDAATGEITAYDGREEAPSAATPDLLLDDSGEPLGFVDAVNSGRSVGTPGVVAMLAAAHDAHGVNDWSTNFDAASDLATDGFAVPRRMADALELRFAFGVSEAFADLYGDGGESYGFGDRFTNPDYADTLQAIAVDWRSFYEGAIPEAIVAAATAEPRPGDLTSSDFADYEARTLSAVCGPYRTFTVCGAPPPTSGGVAVLSILGQLDSVDMAALGESTAGWHHFIEASRRAYADRDAYVGDDRFVAVPVDELLDGRYLAGRASEISPDAATAVVEPGAIPGYERADDSTEEASGTSHFVIRDPAGDVVSMTTSVEFSFGSGRVAAGMVLNNQLTDFAFVPTDDIGPVANAPAGAKRPRSSMAPTIVLDENGEVIYALGSPGGSSIIAYVAKTLVGMIDWGLEPTAAMALPHVVAIGDAVRVEDGADPELLADLESLGHTLAAASSENSGVHLLRVVDGVLVDGAADTRREGTVSVTAS